jgi:hypothetical protein
VFILSFFRFYCCGALAALICYQTPLSWWWLLPITLLLRAAVGLGEAQVQRLQRNRNWQRHCGPFKQFCGPYGIRLVNKAEHDRRIRRSLSEVFVSDPARLQKNLASLEALDALFKAGMAPQGDEYLLHDLKLKYARHRLQQLQVSSRATR